MSPDTEPEAGSLSKWLISGELSGEGGVREAGRMKGPKKDGDQLHTVPGELGSWTHSRAAPTSLQGAEELGATVIELPLQLWGRGCSHQKGHLRGVPRRGWGGSKADP